VPVAFAHLRHATARTGSSASASTVTELHESATDSSRALGAVKESFEAIAKGRPDMVFTHRREDRHQDHRIVST
jgi:LmbE family N-acetylglucosaminyl deacetylase